MNQRKAKTLALHIAAAMLLTEYISPTDIVYGETATDADAVKVYAELRKIALRLQSRALSLQPDPTGPPPYPSDPDDTPASQVGPGPCEF